jgi:hypothetical protein
MDEILKRWYDWASEIIISDESHFGIFDDSRRMWVQCDVYTDRTLRLTPKHNTSFIIWAAIGLGFKSKLIFIEGNLNANGYRMYKQFPTLNLFRHVIKTQVIF